MYHKKSGVVRLNSHVTPYSQSPTFLFFHIRENKKKKQTTLVYSSSVLLSV